jgi:alpha-N-acetylglucosaminidase
MDGVASGPAAALRDPQAGKLRGIGLTMEAIEQNPVIYELMTQHVWQDTVIDPSAWLRHYVRNRYGGVDPRALKAWEILRKTAYNGLLIRDGAESIITGRPTFDSATVWTKTRLNYNPVDLLPAWDLMIQLIPLYGSKDGFRHDLVDLTRQVMANYATPLQQQWVRAFKGGRSFDFSEESDSFITLIDDLDKLLETRREFMVGPYYVSALKWGNTPAQKALYLQNARDLITLWGDANSPLHEYANRQWSGLLGDFYKSRWEQFFSMLRRSLRDSTAPDLAGFEQSIRQWEWKWVTSSSGWPEIGSSLDACGVARSMYRKYRTLIEKAYHE